MVAHERLRAAIEPLAELHRQAGLAVEVVDIQDVYDEFNYGILAPAGAEGLPELRLPLVAAAGAAVRPAGRATRQLGRQEREGTTRSSTRRPPSPRTRHAASPAIDAVALLRGHRAEAPQPDPHLELPHLRRARRG